MRDLAKRIPRRLEKKKKKKKNTRRRDFFVKVDNTRQTLQGGRGRPEKNSRNFRNFWRPEKDAGNFSKVSSGTIKQSTLAMHSSRY
jgi:hypothetical protein